MSRLSNARTELENYEKTRPADYVSQYQPKIKDVMGQLDGMKEFDYDPDADTAYQQYKSQYTRSAKLANQNAQANAAAQTGGYGSSYGTQAGQNAYTATMNNLDNVLNILLIGTDERTEAVNDADAFTHLNQLDGTEDTTEFSDDARADSMILVSLDIKDHIIRLVSIERGTGVPILLDGYEDQYDWITHTFRYGGPKLTMKTVED